MCRELCVLLVAATLFVPSRAQDGTKRVAPIVVSQRIAFVVGNANYKHQQGIPQAINDADDVAAQLTGLGFQVLEVKDAAIDDLDSKLDEFYRTIQPGSLAVFYYSGHGGSIGEENFLLPIEFEQQTTDTAVERHAIRMSTVRDHMEASGARVRLLIFDACRNAALVRAKETSGGLAEMEGKPEGTLIAYASAHGQVARVSSLDARNSSYTTELLKNLQAANVDVETLLRNTADAVYSTTGRRQLPYLYGHLFEGRLYIRGFRSPESDTASVVVPQGIVVAPTEWFRMSGSTTIGLKLAPRLAEEFLRKKRATDVHTEQPDANSNRFLVKGILPGESSPRVIEVRAQGSGQGFKDLQAGTCEIAMASRDVLPDEISRLQGKGDLRRRTNDRTLGLSAVAVIVNPLNDLDQADVKTLADIFSGAATRWSQVPQSGQSGRIQVKARDEKSGTWDIFNEKVLAPFHEQLVADAQRFEDNPKLAAVVEEDANAIGFVDMTFANQGVKVVAVGYTGSGMIPHLPKRLTVLHEEYPLTRRLHFYIPDSSPPVVREFTDFALSDEGQAIVEKEGFVSEMQQQCVAEKDIPKGYPRILQGACKMYTLYFDLGSSKLEGLAMDNIDRLANKIGTAGFRNAAVYVLGHADSVGTHASSLDVSEKRAKTVTDALESRGIDVQLPSAMGDRYPIVPNDPKLGNPRNRRVEVWVKVE